MEPDLSVPVVTSWIKKHETLLIVILVLGFLAFATHGILGYLVKRTDQAYQAKVQELEVARSENKALAGQVAISQAQYAQLTKQVDDLKAQLNVKINTRKAETDIKVKEVLQPDKDLVQVAADIQKTYPELDLAPTVVDADKLAFPLTAVQTFSATRIKLDSAEADKVDLENVIAALEKQNDGADVLIKDLNHQVSGLQNELVIQAGKYETQISNIKAVNRKEKLNWFLRGVLVGATIGLIR